MRVSRGISNNKYLRLPRAKFASLVLATEDARQAEILESDTTLSFVHNPPTRVKEREA